MKVSTFNPGGHCKLLYGHIGISNRLKLGLKVTKIVTYIRVSTAKQGLGLEAQRDAINAFAAAHGLETAHEFLEKETGKGSDALVRRPQLAAALAAAKKLKCPVVVAKLDRLGRNVNFISGLMDARVPFIVTSIGMIADPFMLHIYAALAQQEATMISQRTVAALARVKANGTTLGSPKLAEARVVAAQVVKAEADRFAAGVMPFIKQAQKAGATTQQQIVDALNARGIATARGGAWTRASVVNVMARG
jgi:DNA invertase Pin-like site-specific DNA recombinase